MITIAVLTFGASVVLVAWVARRGQAQQYWEPQNEQRARMIWDLVDGHSTWANIEDGKIETRYEGYERLQRIFNRTGKW